MELVAKVLFGVVCFAGLCFVMGFIEAWWERRKWDKNKRGEVNKQSTAGQQ